MGIFFLFCLDQLHLVLVLLSSYKAWKLATFRGGDSFVLLTDEDMEKLHELAAKVSCNVCNCRLFASNVEICEKKYRQREKVVIESIQGHGSDADNTLALQFLLSNYKDVVSNPVQRAESWLLVISWDQQISSFGLA
ncbi:hypothetical protein ANCDUO_18539 [Ancylostoma duodenale]|uniref:Uncharacterized protein n=1 Tax=Ancylostoma duodenale TaxID=51022 RepID=A0A0C2G2W8_9BILA|nr:hypothetical protein ANCDUO_18539 [Ancylostoma duodenale]